MNLSVYDRLTCHRARVFFVFAIGCVIPIIAIGQHEPRARDLGIPFAGTPGVLNAITDVAGVTVGHTTLISGDGKLDVGSGPVRTGVTAIHPRGKKYDPVFAGWYALNGNGEMTGTTWVEESGFLEGPVVITNTHSVGVARDATIEWQYANNLFDPLPDDPEVFWSLPVVAETYDGDLNDINGFHVTKEHVIDALESAKAGPVSEGNVGGGTGMICHGFKGGIGTASRQLKISDREYTVGVLVQANYGRSHAFIQTNGPQHWFDHRRSCHRCAFVATPTEEISETCTYRHFQGRRICIKWIGGYFYRFLNR